MKKILFLLVGFLALSIIAYFVSPLFYEKEVSESLEEITQQETTQSEDLEMKNSETLKEEFTGKFEGIGIHNSKGTVKIIENNGKKFIRFEEDFEVTNGPDLYVYFGRDGEYSPDGQVALLKGNIGSQNYEVPDSLNVDDYNEIWVWCKQFSTPFAKAQYK